jgi:hypothetical protein
MRSSRRSFLRLAATVSALAGAAPAALARAVTRRAPAAPAAKPPVPAVAGPPPAVAAEIAKQKEATAHALKTVREFPLPAGSEPAFRFVPVTYEEVEP